MANHAYEGTLSELCHALVFVTLDPKLAMLRRFLGSNTLVI